MKFSALSGTVTLGGYSPTHSGNCIGAPMQTESGRIPLALGRITALKNFRFCIALEARAVVANCESNHCLVFYKLGFRG